MRYYNHCRNETGREVHGYACILIHICSALEELMKYHSLDYDVSTGEEKVNPFALTEEEEEIYHALYERNVGEIDAWGRVFYD